MEFWSKIDIKSTLKGKWFWSTISLICSDTNLILFLGIGNISLWSCEICATWAVITGDRHVPHIKLQIYKNHIWDMFEEQKECLTRDHRCLLGIRMISSLLPI